MLNSKNNNIVCRQWIANAENVRAHIFSYLELKLDTNVGIKWDNAYDDWKATKLTTTNGDGDIDRQ